MKKKMLSMLLLCILLLSCVPGYPLKADAAASYNREAAIAYAQEHWNDGKGQCAAFVSRCMIAGGLSMDVESYADGAACAILGAIGKPTAFSTDYDPYQAVCTKAVLSDGYMKKADNENLLKEGDVVFYYCETDHVSPHIMLFGGWNNKGYATFYCHNSANCPANQQGYNVYMFTASSSVMVNNGHKSSCQCTAYIIHFDDCDHSPSPDGFGFCTRCGAYDPQKDVRSSGVTTYPNARYYTLNCACRVRKGPYEECDSPDGSKTAKGTRFTVVGELTNGRGHLWYITSDGRYIYGERADYAGEDSAVRFGEVSGSATDTNAVLKTTVYKQRGADAQTYGVAIIGFPKNDIFGKLFVRTKEFPDTYVSNSSTSYTLTLDLTEEAGWILPVDHTFYANLFVQVDGARYTAKTVKFETSAGGLFVSDPILDAETVKQIEAAGPELTPAVAAESSGAITWNDASVTNVTNTSALVKYTLTPDKSRIRRIGMQYCTDGSSFADVPGCEWAGSTLTSFCSVAFDGSEGPRLAPGTTYYCRFYIIRTDGGTEYSPVITFTTAAGSSEAITWNEPSVTDLSETTALVKYTLTPNKSLIARIGMQYCTDGSSFANVPGCEWAGSTLTSFCSVAFDGSEGPCLTPGTKYYCRFYIIRTDGAAEYSPVITFTTGGTAIREYTVSLNVNRDDGAITESTRIRVSTGGTFGSLPAPFSACAAFLGWYTEPEGGRLIESNTPVTDDCPAELYAHWQPLSYTVFFDPAGGSAAYGSKIVTNDLPFGELPVPVRSGYEFLGWFADDMTAFAVQPEWVVSAWQNFTLTARWAKLEEEAPEKVNTIQLWIDRPFLSVNGEVTAIDSEGTVPVIRSDRTLLPIRCIIEAMGGTVGWDGANRMVTLSLGDRSLYMIIGSTSVLDQSGTYHTLDSAPVIIHDRTMLPVRFVSEFFGAAVDWDGETRMVTITY